MKKKIILLIVCISFIVNLSACGKSDVYQRFDGTFFDAFDTITRVVMYTQSKADYEKYMDYIEGRFWELHKLYDKYNDYDGINNIKTINDMAGIKPVEVEDEIIDLILFSKKWYEIAGEETNIAFGPVLRVWSSYRDIAEADPSEASIPTKEELEEANRYIDIDKIIVDEENKTVFLEDENMYLDVGAVAKGYATELVAREVEAMGLTSALISVGGNIRGIGKPEDNIRGKWGVGLQNPDKNIIDRGNVLETVFVNDMSIVSSGDYERYYYYGDQRIHHIIDPKTLMPGNFHRAVTIITEDSGLADFLSTSIFLLNYEEGRELADSLDGVEVLWVTKEGEVLFTEGLREIMLSQGATGEKGE